MSEKSLTHPKNAIGSAVRGHSTLCQVVGVCCTYVYVPGMAIPNVVNSAQHVPISVGGLTSTTAAAVATVRVGRARGSMDDEYGVAHNNRDDVYGRRFGRLASNGGRHGVRTPKMRAVRISHLSFHARHLRVAIGDIGI